MEQLNSLHVKLDKILNVLEPKAIKPSTPKKEVTDSVSEPKVVKPAVVKKKVKEEKV